MILTHQFVAELSLLGMGLDCLGGCYLAYDLLGGKRGPLRTIARATGYIALFFTGYGLVLGLRYAVVAALGMGILLAIEYRRAEARPDQINDDRSAALVFGFLRGVVLGLASSTAAGLKFAAIFGTCSGVGLMIVYCFGYAPTNEYKTAQKPELSGHKLLASSGRACAVGLAGVTAGLLTSSGNHSIVFGLRLGVAAGIVSAAVGIFSPSIEWWIGNLPERRLGVIGLALILLGMIVQSTQYWLAVFDVALS